MREDDRLGARPDADLVEEVRDVVSDRLLSDREALADLGISEPISNERQDFAFTPSERRERRVLAALPALHSRELHDRLAEPFPRRLMTEQHVVLGIELYELRSWDPRGQQASLCDRDNRVVATVYHDCWHPHLLEQPGDVVLRQSSLNHANWTPSAVRRYRTLWRVFRDTVLRSSSRDIRHGGWARCYANRDERPMAGEGARGQDGVAELARGISRRGAKAQCRTGDVAMLKRVLFFAFGSLSYLIFLGTFLYPIGFIGNFGAPSTLDGPANGPLWIALGIDVGLLGLFAAQHSVMARPWFKRQWTRIVPGQVERSTYVLFSSRALIALFWQWRPLGGEIWAVTDPAYRCPARPLRIRLGARAGVDVPDKPLRPVRAAPGPARAPRPTVRPAAVCNAWALPARAPSALCRLVLRVLDDADNDAVREHGESYERYRRSVPMLVPFSKRRAEPVVTPEVQAMD